MAVVTVHSDFGAQENCFKFLPFYLSGSDGIRLCDLGFTNVEFSPSIYHEVKGLGAMVLVFLILSFKPDFSLFSFTFTKRLFSSSSLSVIRVVSSAYLRLLIFLPAILITACDSSVQYFA